MRIGETVFLYDGMGQAREAVVETITKGDLRIRIVADAAAPPPPPLDITIAQGIGKGDRFEQVIQHGTELGASAFIPLLTARTVVKLRARDIPDKLERWRQVAKSDAEQSGREKIPAVHPPADLDAVAERFGQYPLALLLDGSGIALARILGALPNIEQSPCILRAGPEGGFTAEEVNTAREHGARIVSLGPYTLRTETAALAAISQLTYWSTGEDGWSTPLTT